MPWPGTDPETFLCTGGHSTNRATLVRASILFYFTLFYVITEIPSMLTSYPRPHLTFRSDFPLWPHSQRFFTLPDVQWFSLTISSVFDPWPDASSNFFLPDSPFLIFLHWPAFLRVSLPCLAPSSSLSDPLRIMSSWGLTRLSVWIHNFRTMLKSPETTW